MPIALILFIMFSAAAVIMALMAVTVRHPVKAAYFLSAFLASVSILFAIPGLYIPAVLHLLLSGVSLLFYLRTRNRKNGNSEVRTEHPGWKKVLPAALISVSGAVVTGITIINFRFAPSKKPDSGFSLQEFSSALFNPGKDGFLLPLILLAIMTAAAVLAYVAVKEGRITDTTVLKGKKTTLK